MVVSIVLGFVGACAAVVCIYTAIKIHLSTYRELGGDERDKIWAIAEKWVSSKPGLKEGRLDAKRAVAEYIANKKQLTMGLFNEKQ